MILGCPDYNATGQCDTPGCKFPHYTAEAREQITKVHGEKLEKFDSNIFQQDQGGGKGKGKGKKKKKGKGKGRGRGKHS
jgi:hypothetical protein